MAEIIVSVREDQDLGIFEVVGGLQSGELSKSFIDNHDAYMKKRRLLDFSRGKLSSMDLDTLIDRTRSSKIFDREGTRIAFFLPDDLEFGTGMMVKSYAESFGYLAEISVFRCVNETLNWLTAE